MKKNTPDTRKYIPIIPIDDNEYKDIVNGKEIRIRNTFDFFFEINERFGSDYIEGYIVDNRNNYLYTYPGIYNFLEKYHKHESVYFSFDGVSLWKLINIKQTHNLLFMLKQMKRKKINKRNTAFMIMPFNNPTRESIYIDIRDFLESELQITLRRADEFLENDIVIETIYREIEQSEIIIAETTICNKNVFYEIGYAAAMDKEIISIQDNCQKEAIYFDRRHIRHLFYDFNNIERFFNDLKNTIVSIRSRY